MYRVQYGEYAYWCQGVKGSWGSALVAIYVSLRILEGLMWEIFLINVCEKQAKVYSVWYSVINVEEN